MAIRIVIVVMVMVVMMLSGMLAMPLAAALMNIGRWTPAAPECCEGGLSVGRLLNA